MKKILLYGLLGFVGLIAVCTVVVIAVDTGGGSSTVTKEERAQLMKVTTQEVYQAYKQNEARANVTYKDQKLDVSFTVDRIEDRYVVQDLDDFMDAAQLYFSEEDLINFNIGERASAVCELDGFQIDTFLEFDCR